MKILRVLVGVMLLAGCGTSLSTEWAAADTLLVVRDGDQRLVVGIDVRGGRVLPLASFAGPPGTGSAPDTAMIAVGGRTLILSGDGFAADVHAVDRGLSESGRIEAGQFPMVVGPTLVGVGAGRVAVSYRDLVEVSRATWDEQVVAGDGNCVVGTTGDLPRRSGVLRRGVGPSVRLGVDTVPLGVSCDNDTALVSVTTEGLDAPSRVLRVRGGNVEEIQVGPNPRAVRLLGGGLAAVDVARGNGRAIRIIDLGSGRVRSEASVPGTSQVTSIGVTRSGVVVAVGGRFATIVDPRSGTANTLELPGDSLVYLSRL